MREARFLIPLVEEEITAKGGAYTYRLISRTIRPASPQDAALLDIEPGSEIMHLKCLHLSDGAPYEFENRLVNLAVAPRIRDESFENVSPNDWLVKNVPFSRAEFTFLAAAANKEEARWLAIAPSSPIFVGERRTWLLLRPITFVRRANPPSYRLTTAL